MSVFKETLMSALHDAVQYFNQDKDPNAAVVKAASEHDFNADQTTRLVETFNTARTIYHYKTASDRTHDFQLADAGVVLPLLFKTEPEKAASAVVDDIRDYSIYNTPEADYRGGLVIEKVAGVQELDLGEVTEHADTSLGAQADQAYRIIHAQRDLAKTARDEANAAGTQAGIILAKVARSLSLGYEDQVMPRYNSLLSGYLHGEAHVMDLYAPVMTKLNEHVPAWMKKAFVQDDSVIDDRGMTPILAQIDEARGYMESEAEMLALAGQLDKEADAFEAEWLSIALPGFQQTKDAGVIGFLNTELLEKAAQTTITGKRDTTDLFGNPISVTSKKDILPMVAPITSGAGKAVETGVTGLLGEMGTALSAEQERGNKQLSERLKNTQRQIMLEDLLSTDPVLSSEDPQTVARAYEAVLSLAPDVASNKEVVRAVLRQAVHSVAISPYEAGAWTDLERNIRQLSGKMPQPPQAKPQVAGKGGR
jgi:hypothetical protein